MWGGGGGCRVGALNSLKSKHNNSKQNKHLVKSNPLAIAIANLTL